jgi:putative hydroxymethylpyrimidine transport system ATP-binding protein
MIEKAPSITFKGTATIGERVLFDSLSLTIKSEQFTCLLGASGVGKSTILRLIAGLETGADFSGTIVADNKQSLKDQIGYMAQGGELFPWASVLDNVNLGSKLRGQRADKARALHVIEQVCFADHMHKRPSTLSGGEQQRVALARTLIEDRPIVLLDEPFSALDAKTRSEMQELAGQLLADRTVLLVTHDPSEAARISHSIWVMTEDGLSNVTVPDRPPVRAIDDEDTLSCQGRLYRILRGIET